MPKKKSSTLYFGASQPGLIRPVSNEVSSPYGARADSGKIEQATVGTSGKKRAPASGRLVIGVWDVDVHSGFLNLVLDRINGAQKKFQFHPIEAMVPVGLTFSGERTRRVAAAYAADHKLAFDDEVLATNTLASDIYEVAQPIRTALELDLLVVVVSPMIMDLDTSSGEPESWNLFSTSKDGVVIASAYNLREYAREAKRSFEGCLAAVVAAAVVQETYDKVESHSKTRGCIFDFCDDRNDIVKGLRTINVCKVSLNQVPQSARADVAAMFDAIRDYTP